MVRRGRISTLAVLFAALPLALAACGGGDKSSDSSSRSTSTVAGATGGTTGATGATGSKGTTDTGGAKAGGSTGSGGASAGTGSNSNSSGGSSTGGTGSGKSQSPKKSKPKKPKFLPGAFLGQKDQLYKQSKTVCHALTLNGLAHEYNVKPKTPSAVAKRYAKAYPSSIRNAVYRGCRAGLS